MYNLVVMILILSLGLVGVLIQYRLGCQLSLESSETEQPTIDYFKNLKFNMANMICYVRILFGFICGYGLYYFIFIDFNILLQCIIVAFSANIAIGDYLDGKIAKNCGLTSNYGARLDAFADKIFYICILLALTYGYIDLQYTIYVIIFFDAMGPTLREFQDNPAAINIGKIKTCVIFGSMFFLYLLTALQLVTEYMLYLEIMLYFKRKTKKERETGIH
jgi:phosphatidylglycerophosphate synthase